MFCQKRNNAYLEVLTCLYKTGMPDGAAPQLISQEGQQLHVIKERQAYLINSFLLPASSPDATVTVTVIWLLLFLGSEKTVIHTLLLTSHSSSSFLSQGLTLVQWMTGYLLMCGEPCHCEDDMWYMWCHDISLLRVHQTAKHNCWRQPFK